MKLKTLNIIIAIAVPLAMLLPALPARAAFTPNIIMPDRVFDSVNSMNAAQIDAFLNARPNSCISTNNGFSAPEPISYSPAGPTATLGFTYGGDVSAGTIIYNSAKVYGLNPQVILATLDKEEGLVTGSGTASNPACSNLRYSAAMGYLCTDTITAHDYSGFELYSLNGTPVTSVTGTCVQKVYYVGFSRQVIWATWTLMRGEQRSEGNVNWNAQVRDFPHAGNIWDNSDDPPACYPYLMTQGYRARADSTNTNLCAGTPANQVNYYDGMATIDGTSVHLDTGATASLYNYTPHFSGNQSFVNIFTNWFGNPNTTCLGIANVSAVPSGIKILAYKLGTTNQSSLSLTLLNNTGSACVEMHADNTSLNTWINHVATGMRAIDPATGTLVASKSRVDNQEALNFINYIGGGQVEVHRISPNFLKLPGYYDVSTNLSNVTPTSGMFVAGDFFGIGYDQLAYIIYSNGTGNLEIHMFDPTLTKAVGFYDLVTDITGASATNGTLVAGDFLGRGYSQLAYITYGSTEVHLLDIRNGRAARLYEVPTNLRGATSSNGTFVAGDFLGIGHDQLLYVIYNNGDGSFGGLGHVETHMFDTSLTKVNGTQDIVTNMIYTP